MPLQNLEYWVLVQVGLEVGLTVLVIFFLVRIRSWGQMLQAFQQEGPIWSEEIARLTAQLTELEKKGASLEEMVNQLSLKSTALEKQLDLVLPRTQKRSSSGPTWENGPSLRAQVETLDRQGLGPEEIARRLRLNLAEVKVALDLSRVRAT